MKKLILTWLVLSYSCFGALTSWCVADSDTLKINSDQDIKNFLQAGLQIHGNSGHPFAEYVLDSYERHENNEYIIYRTAKRERVRIDTVIFGRYTPREVNLLSHYTELPDSGKFSYDYMIRTLSNLRSLDWLDVENRVGIYQNAYRFFTDANQDVRFDAVASYKQSGENQGVVGNVSCRMVNLFGLGRRAQFNWSRPDLSINEIAISYREPFVFNRPFSVSAAFHQRFEDSSYVKRDLNLSVIYHINAASQLIVTYRDEKISTYSPMTENGYITQKRYGSTADLIWMRRFSDKLSAQSNLSAGVVSLSGSIISRVSGRISAEARHHYTGINARLLGGHMQSKHPLADYDRFRLGGADFLRGSYFEQHIVNSFAGWQLEAGFFQKETGIYLFYDGALLENPVHQAGIEFMLPAGKNTLIIGIGSDLKQNLRNAKFHISWK